MRHTYECGRDNCPGTTGTAHPQNACPAGREVKLTAKLDELPSAITESVRAALSAHSYSICDSYGTPLIARDVEAMLKEIGNNVAGMLVLSYEIEATATDDVKRGAVNCSACGVHNYVVTAPGLPLSCFSCSACGHPIEASP